MKNDEKYLVRDGVCLFLGNASEGSERLGALVSVDRLLGRVLGELFSRKWPALFVKCVRRRTCGNDESGFRRDVREAFVKSGLMKRGFFPSSDDYTGALCVLRARQTAGCVLREQKACAGQESVGQKSC